MTDKSPALVIGGARSGKSAYAQELAQRSGRACLYLATALAGDDEMAERIALHQADRGAGWRTVEEPLNLVSVISDESAPDTVIVVDCLTLWLSNLIGAGRDPQGEGQNLCTALGIAPGPVICVSNEVGSGIVPANALARRFADCQGRLNQQVAKVCGTVVALMAGLPVILKPTQQPEIDL